MDALQNRLPRWLGRPASPSVSDSSIVLGGWYRAAAGCHQFGSPVVLDLPHSEGCFVKAYPAETTEAFLDGHVSAGLIVFNQPCLRGCCPSTEAGLRALFRPL